MIKLEPFINTNTTKQEIQRKLKEARNMYIVCKRDNSEFTPFWLREYILLKKLLKEQSKDDFIPIIAINEANLTVNGRVFKILD